MINLYSLVDQLHCITRSTLPPFFTWVAIFISNRYDNNNKYWASSTPVIAHYARHGVSCEKRRKFDCIGSFVIALFSSLVFGWILLNSIHFYFSLKKRNYLLSGTVLCLWLCTANVLSCFLWGMSSCFSPLLCIHPSYRLFLFVMSCPLSYCIYFFNEARTSLVHCLCLLLFILARLQLCLFINATKLTNVTLVFSYCIL